MDVPTGDWSRQMAEAQRMMQDLRGRDFRKHLREAEAEKTEAQHRKASPDSSVSSNQLEMHFSKHNLKLWAAGGRSQFSKPCCLYRGHSGNGAAPSAPGADRIFSPGF